MKPSVVWVLLLCVAFCVAFVVRGFFNVSGGAGVALYAVAVVIALAAINSVRKVL